jgi:hypothetical protein
MDGAFERADAVLRDAILQDGIPYTEQIGGFDARMRCLGARMLF